MGPQSFAALIRAHRRAARMTVRELAAASGVSVRAIGDMERGQSAARQGTLDALARALTLTAAERADLASAAGAVRSAPAGALPRDVPDFTGRRAEIDRLTRFLRHGAPVVVHGPPGVGKTALAVHVAGRFFGAVRFLDCRRTDPAPRRAASDPVVLDDAVDPQQSCRVCRDR